MHMERIEAADSSFGVAQAMQRLLNRLAKRIPYHREEIYRLVADSINASFSVRNRLLISISRLSADDLSAQQSTNTNSTGPRARVYFVAVPALCAARRFLRSLVMPV
jgi:hypothetical protein